MQLDQMFGSLTLDQWTAEELRFLAPHYGAWKLEAPRAIGDNMPLPKPVVTSLVNYIYDYDEVERLPDPRKLDRMKEMFTMEEY